MLPCTPTKSSLARSLGARRRIWLSGFQKWHSRLVSNKRLVVNGLFKGLPHAGWLQTQHWLQTSRHCSPTLIGLTGKSSHTGVLPSVVVCQSVETWNPTGSLGPPVQPHAIIFNFSSESLGDWNCLSLKLSAISFVLSKLIIGWAHFVWKFPKGKAWTQLKKPGQLWKISLP